MGANRCASDAMLADYYRLRAGEYEAVYAKPERQAELATLRTWLADAVRGRRVLELACGTGYWTAVAAPLARSIDAFDVNDETLTVARAKGLPRTRFAISDAYAPVAGDYDCVLACFWWSHVPLSDLARFMRGAVAAARPGARLIMIDNVYAEASSTPISRRDSGGNTYQMRQLADGSRHEVLKNFPAEADLRAALARHSSAIDCGFLRYYWRLQATLTRALCS